NNLSEIDKALAIGAKKATKVANNVLKRVRKKVGYNNQIDFSDSLKKSYFNKITRSKNSWKKLYLEIKNLNFIFDNSLIKSNRFYHEIVNLNDFNSKLKSIEQYLIHLQT